MWNIRLGGAARCVSKRTGPRFTKNLKSDRNRKLISGAKMRFTKIIILRLRVFSNVTKL